MALDGIPYPIFSYAALVPWTFFASGLIQSSNSLVGSANLIRKIYFPRLAVPIASVLSGVVDFVLAFLVLLGMMFYYGIAPTINVLWLPLLLLLALVTSLEVVHPRDNVFNPTLPEPHTIKNIFYNNQLPFLAGILPCAVEVKEN